MRPTCSRQGYKFDVSATISLKEEPEKYKPLAGIANTGEKESDEEGRPIVGPGDNVFKAPADVTGTARYISDVDRVMEMLTDGVPAGTIAIIDDSGGTLTAPIVGDFAGVVCMGGTIRSHLGILTREYSVPCLMNAPLDGLADGDEVTVEYSKPAADAYADAESASGHRARIIKISWGINACETQLRGSAGGQQLHPEVGRLVLLAVHDAHRAGVEALPVNPYIALSYYNAWYRYPGAAAQGRRGDAGRGDRRPRPPGRQLRQHDLDGRRSPVLPRRPPVAAGHGHAQADRRGRRHDGRARFRGASTSPTTARGHIMPSDGNHKDQVHSARQTEFFEDNAIGVTPGDKLHTAFTHFMAAVSAYGFLSHCECRLSFNNHGPYRTKDGNEMLVRDLVDLAECDYPWMDGVAAAIEFNNLTIPVIMKDTHFHIVDDWGSFEAHRHTTTASWSRSGSTPPTGSRTATSPSTWTAPRSWPTTSTTSAERWKRRQRRCGR